MTPTTAFGKFLRALAISLLAVTSATMLLGGIGTTCVAWFIEKYPSFSAIIPVQWLYRVASIVTTLAAVAGIWATVGLSRGRRDAYTWSLGALVVGLLFAGAQMIASELLRGKSAPNNMRVVVTAFTLLVFLLLRLPPLWRRIPFERGGQSGGGPAASLAAFSAGLLILSVPLWAGPTHTQDGYNLVFVLRLPILLAGGALTAGGIAGLAGRNLARRRLAPTDIHQQPARQ